MKTDLGILDCLGEVLGVGTYDEVALHSIEVVLHSKTLQAPEAASPR